MKLNTSESIFNMGDTSIRVKQVIDVYRLILEHTEDYVEDSEQWKGNSELHENFYLALLQKIHKLEEVEGVKLFKSFQRLENYSRPSKSRLGMRGRTLTNSLVKTGLLNDRRELSEVGKRYLNNELKNPDEFESLLNLNFDNLVYLRQFLKLRIYSPDGSHYFYPFRFALNFLAKHSNVPEKHFLTIVLSIRPDQSQEYINEVMNEYIKVKDGKQSFREYYNEKFLEHFRPLDNLDLVEEMFRKKDFATENFEKFFWNKKGKKESIDLYRDFVVKVVELKENTINTNVKILEELKKISQDEKIKRAFSAGKAPFTFSKKLNVKDFLEKNKESPLLNGDNLNIYLEFIKSKHLILIDEYSDMLKRTFNVTGLFSFDNKLVNMNDVTLIESLIEYLDESFVISGDDESYDKYELSDSSLWFKDLSILDLFYVENEKRKEILKTIGLKIGESDLEGLREKVIIQKEKDFELFIDKKFPLSKVIKILTDISNRNDDDVFKEVTDNATIPTIYEYILTIAWYYIAEKRFAISKAFQVTLDGEMLPLSHRGGGAGDIEIVTDRYALLLEATLMDVNNQRRNELEPVIRHSVNFSLDNKEKSPQTIFIANDLDTNVLNIFRATQFIELTGTLVEGKVSGLNIFALTTNEVIEILHKEINDIQILKRINESLNAPNNFIKDGWREDVIQSILE